MTAAVFGVVLAGGCGSRMAQPHGSAHFNDESAFANFNHRAGLHG